MNTGGLSFLGTLTLMFIAFKLLEVITWSWWWVLAPIWIPGTIVVIVLLFFIVTQ